MNHKVLYLKQNWKKEILKKKKKKDAATNIRLFQQGLKAEHKISRFLEDRKGVSNTWCTQKHQLLTHPMRNIKENLSNQ